LDYKKDNIPVILGGGLKDKFKVGDKMNWEARTSMSDDSKIMVTFEVVGFYKENEMIWFNTFDTLAGSAIFANSSIIYPRVKGLQDISYGNVLGDGGIYFELTPEMDIKEAHSAILEAIKPIGDKYGYEFNVVKSTSLQKDLELLGLNLDRDSGITKILAVVFTIISVLGITSTMLGELKRRKKEFGVRLSQGATINKICIELLIEIFLICLISSLFSLALVWWMNSAVTLSSRIILINLMYITILTCVISIIPLIFMRKMDIIELVRGK
ncbi:MAG: FtsX-like permease family protein, partial [Clostridium sp.]